MRGFVAIGVLVVLMCPSVVRAQATITGQVTDSAGRTRIAAGIDLYNALNSSDALTYNTSFFAASANGSVGFPSSVLTPRLLRFTAEVSF